MRPLNTSHPHPQGHAHLQEPRLRAHPAQEAEAPRAHPPQGGQKLRFVHGHPAHPQAQEARARHEAAQAAAQQLHHAQPVDDAHPHAQMQHYAQPRPMRAPAEPPRAGQSFMQAQMQNARARVATPRRDPAPSRLAYRLERLWLRPSVRAITRIGLPVFCVVLGLGVWLGDDARRADLVGQYEDLRERIQHRPEFMVSLMKIEGASPEVDGAIRAMAPVALPASSFDIDLDAYRGLIKRLDAVAEASLVIRPGGTLEIKVTEREPVILWRTATSIEMLDATGHRVATVTARDVRPDLPLIAGAGADRAVPEALALLQAAGPILPRLRGLVRMGERRWDVVLDRNQRLMLPEQNPVRAMDRVLALDAAEDLLSRDFTHLDMRNNDRPTIRLSETSLEKFREITGQVTKAKAGQ